MKTRAAVTFMWRYVGLALRTSDAEAHLPLPLSWAPAGQMYLLCQTLIRHCKLLNLTFLFGNVKIFDYLQPVGNFTLAAHQALAQIRTSRNLMSPASSSTKIFQQRTKPGCRLIAWGVSWAP